MTWATWVATIAVVLAAAAVWLAVQNRRTLLAHGIALRASIRASVRASGGAGAAKTGPTGTGSTLVAFVANPTKPGIAALREAAVRACAARFAPAPLWYETTIEDPGVGQAREAVDRGAALVVAIGGDGTVRSVAEGLAGTDVPMGLLPQGTGNLLARNLDLPLGDVDSLLRIALSGTDRPIDVGWLTVVRDEWHPDGSADDSRPETAVPGPETVVPGPEAAVPGPETAVPGPEAAVPGPEAAVPGPEAAVPGPEAAVPGPETAVPGPGAAPDTAPGPRETGQEHIFLVIAGLGFDAAMVADADEALKAKVGWIAYFVAGIKHLHTRRMRLQLCLDDSPWFNVRLRSLIIGNCGRLPGGITLLPDAVVDDGWLDVGAIDTRVGVVGWGWLFGEVALQRFGVRSPLTTKAGRIDHARAREVRVRAREPHQIQVDGDAIGRAFEVATRVEPLSLIVRVERAGRP